jgi:hypothetical protein
MSRSRSVAVARSRRGGIYIPERSVRPKIRSVIEVMFFGFPSSWRPDEGPVPD